MTRNINKSGKNADPGVTVGSAAKALALDDG